MTSRSFKTPRFPSWLQYITRICMLSASGVSKQLLCLETNAKSGLQTSFSTLDWAMMQRSLTHCLKWQRMKSQSQVKGSCPKWIDPLEHVSGDLLHKTGKCGGDWTMFVFEN